MDTNLHEPFIQLVRLGIGKYKDAKKPKKGIDWSEIKALAEMHGLSAVVLDGIEKASLNYQMPLDIKLQWIGEVLQGYEGRYKSYKKAISEMAGFYNQHGFKMMVLKGYACSLDWPKPEHRPCGDIDIWQFGMQKETDSLLEKEKGIKIDKSHHHHTVFQWGNFEVENHYDFINIYHHKSHSRLEKIFKDLGLDDNYYVELYGKRIYLPSPNLHALFLLKHTMLHFVSGEINLRQLLDWAFFVEKHGKEVDWKWLEGILDEYGMMPAFNIFNAICVEDLGFDPGIFHRTQFNPTVKDRALNEILFCESTNKGPTALFTRVVYRYQRWRNSEWKHKLCYKESMWSSFLSGVWGHLLKPTSI